MDIKDVAEKISKAAPTIVRVVLINGEIRNLKPGAGTSRKRWLPITKMIERMEWRRIEMYGPGEAFLDFVDNEDQGEKALVVSKGDREDQLMNRVILAQREALSWQDKGIKLAMETIVDVMREQATAVREIVAMHKAMNEGLRSMLAEADRGTVVSEDPENAELIKMLMPHLAMRLMGSIMPAAPGPAKGGNGNG